MQAQKERHGVTLSTIDKDRNHNTLKEKIYTNYRT